MLEQKKLRKGYGIDKQRGGANGVDQKIREGTVDVNYPTALLNLIT